MAPLHAHLAHGVLTGPPGIIPARGASAAGDVSSIVTMTRAERAALAAAIARLVAMVDADDLEATDAQRAWLLGYLAGLSA